MTNRTFTKNNSLLKTGSFSDLTKTHTQSQSTRK